MSDRSVLGVWFERVGEVRRIERQKFVCRDGLKLFVGAVLGFSFFVRVGHGLLQVVVAIRVGVVELIDESGSVGKIGGV